MDQPISWREAMQQALYGPAGFFTRHDRPGATGHFRTSALASPLFAGALLRIITAADRALGRPEQIQVVDVGAGQGHLLRRLAELAPPPLGPRLSLCAVDLAPRPPDLPAGIEWQHDVPDQVRGVLLATEWLDNVPVDIAQVDEAGRLRYVLVDPGTGDERLGGELADTDLDWARTWWWREPLAPGTRVEIGAPRDAAWAAAVGAVSRGIALAVDYGHISADRPLLGTLSSYAAGHQVQPVPDGSRDVTAHVAIDAVRAAGEAVTGQEALLLSQRSALHALGVRGARPPLALASADPAAYLRALGEAGEAAELTDRVGLGRHFWLIQPVGIDPAALGLPDLA